MHRLGKRTTLFLLLGSVLLLLIFAVLAIQRFGQKSSENSNTNKNEASDTSSNELPGYLDGVNLEDNYPIVRQAGVPFENNQFAIMFSVASDAPKGVIFYAIDKTSRDGMSSEIQAAVVSYFTQHGIDVSTITIKYMDLEEWKSIQT